MRHLLLNAFRSLSLELIGLKDAIISSRTFSVRILGRNINIRAPKGMDL